MSKNDSFLQTSNNQQRPRSPDLNYPNYTPVEPTFDHSTGFPEGYKFTHRTSYDASPYFSPSTASPASYFPSQSLEGNSIAPPLRTGLSDTFFRSSISSDYTQSHHSQTFSHSRTSSTFSPSISHKGLRSPEQIFHPPPAPFHPYVSTQVSATPTSPQSNMPRPRRKVSDDEDMDDADFAPYAAPNRRGQRSKTSDMSATTEGMHSPMIATGEGPGLGIDVKTKFPVARIKRIMQADEDVGKVANATPTAVCESICLPVDFASR